MITQTNIKLRELDPINGREIYLYGCLVMCYMILDPTITAAEVLEKYIEAKSKGIIGSKSFLNSPFDLLQLLNSNYQWVRREEGWYELQEGEIGIMRFQTSTGTHFKLYNAEGLVYDPYSKEDEDVNYEIVYTKESYDRVDILRRK